MGLDRVYLKDWVGMRSVKMPDCLVNASSLVCYSLERFYVAGVIFKILWIVSLLVTAHNTCNLYANLNYKRWRWCQFEFLHLLAPVLWVFSFVLWYVVAEVFVRSNFIYEFGCLGAMGLGLGQCGLAIYYYHYKLVEDEGNAPSYLALPS